jgi:hypothetical protein
MNDVIVAQEETTFDGLTGVLQKCVSMMVDHVYMYVRTKNIHVYDIHTGMPDAKLVVPSIGSTHHNHSFPSFFRVNSSASMRDHATIVVVPHQVEEV